MCHGLCSTSSTSSVSHVVWADLLDCLIHQIIARLSSFHDFLAFTGTCRPWRVAASSFASVYTFTFPPLHLKIDFHYTCRRGNNGKFSLLRKCKWLLGDHSKREISHRCSVPRNSPNCLLFLGCSYGYLIFSYGQHCLLADVYTDNKVNPPKIEFRINIEIYCGILTAPPNSPNSCLLLCSKTSMFQWQFGANSWSEHPLGLGQERILQILLFKGQILAMDFSQRLHIIQLSPRFSMERVEDFGRKDMAVSQYDNNPWLVVCGDTLLMVALSPTHDEFYASFFGTFQVFRLDFSVKPAKWVKMEKLENCALFVGIDRRTPTFSCMSPERWGGKSNTIYVSSALENSDEQWTPVELGQTVPSATTPGRSAYFLSVYGHCSQLQSLWVLPSLVYGT
uniref:Uncharacterized protein n=1 Tax=Avena sativa TaxID=4498 RepID=A0ACD5TCP2_AVESA